jgi:hypothetical protein
MRSKQESTGLCFREHSAYAKISWVKMFIAKVFYLADKHNFALNAGFKIDI